MPRHQDCWAKTTKDAQGREIPGINVRDHCLNVGCVAEALIELLPAQLKALLPCGAATLAALHDIGKVSPGFQKKCPDWLVRYPLPYGIYEEDHAKVSQFTVREMLGASHLHDWAAIVGAHHGRLKGALSRQRWEDERRRLAKELIAQFGPLPDRPGDEAVIWFTAGLISVADWIGSDEFHFLQDATWDIKERRRRAAAALRINGWKRISIGKSLSFPQLFPGFTANNLQNVTTKLVSQPGVYVIEGPMGYGKTEAALAAGYQIMAKGMSCGLYFGLPTQITSNRIHERVQPFVDRISKRRQPVRLAHSASWLTETAPPLRLRAASPDRDAADHVRVGRSWFASPKRALLAPFGVGTIDQALLGIVAAKHFFVRQFGLAGKLVILDEVHTYDLYTSTLIDALVKRLRELQCTVIILSATLTEKRRRELLGLNEDQPISAAYPLVSGIAASSIEQPCTPPPPKSIVVRAVTGSISAEDVIAQAQRGACVLWIRNTVDEAQETYRAIQSANFQGGPPVALLHSRFPFFRREELEEEWMSRLSKDSTKRPAGCVLVSTQVAEQSVDIDADLLITDLAPTDMLLQRIGRLWRHERGSRPCTQPEVWIQTPPLQNNQLNAATEKDLRQALGKSARVYAPYVLLRSLQQWRKRTTITMPTDIRPILEATYNDPSATEPAAWRELREQLERQKEKMARQAVNATAIWNIPALPDEEDIQTRYSTYPMAQVLLAREITRQDVYTVRLELLNGETVMASDHDWNFDTAKAIHRNLTRVPRWALSAFLPNTPGWLANHVHQATAFGLLQADGGIRAVNNDTDMGLSYHADQGIIIHRERVPRAMQEEFDESYD
ncbi:MAG TPA: CRISPR-associated helicase Cas3' [Candidatus Binatia bacterium]|nr:CRISPR-associated helicase Cas3' [Candidatus Binatia bacterium]